MWVFSKKGLIPYLIRKFFIRKENKTLRCFFVPINMFRGYFLNEIDISNGVIVIMAYTAYKNWHGTS